MHMSIMQKSQTFLPNIIIYNKHQLVTKDIIHPKIHLFGPKYVCSSWYLLRYFDHEYDFFFFVLNWTYYTRLQNLLRLS